MIFLLLLHLRDHESSISASVRAWDNLKHNAALLFFIFLYNSYFTELEHTTHLRFSVFHFVKLFCFRNKKILVFHFHLNIHSFILINGFQFLNVNNVLQR